MKRRFCFRPPGALLGAGLAGVLVLAQTRPDRVAPIRFHNIAAEAGIDFVYHNSPTPQKHLIETMPGGVAAFDYDGDGRTDIFFTNGAAIPSLQKDSPKYRNRLYRNLGGWKFEDVTDKANLAGSGYSMGAAAADFDNDGNADLFVAGVNGNHLYRNNGKGSFEDVTRQAGIRGDVWSVGGAWLDYDNDGYLDLFVVNYLKWAPDMDRYCGDREGNLRVYCHPRYFEGLPDTLYRNRGDGTFEDVSAKSGIGAHVGKGMSAAVADYDHDGLPDIFVTNDTVPNFLFHNLGGKFEEVGLGALVGFNSDGRAVSSMSVDFRDYDNDGWPDLSVTALSGESFPLFRNRGNGKFADATYSSGLGMLTRGRAGWSNGFFDFNNDGWKDLFTANSHVNDRVEHFEAARYRQTNSVFANAGGRFEDVSAAAGFDSQSPRAHRGAGFADFNGDGRIDVVVSALEDPAELWENVSPDAGNWIVLKLTGTRSNRDGIGARVRIGDQHNHMTTSVGYNSSSHFGVHFGLGRAPAAGRIEIVWPSGKVQVLEGVEANRVVQVREPG